MSLQSSEPSYLERKRLADSARGRRRTAAEQRRREEQAEARALGVPVVRKLTIDRLWTDEERAVVQALYPDYQAMMARLPHRSRGAIRGVVRTLGLVDPRKVWTGPAEARLAAIFKTATPDELREAFPGLSLKQIIAKGKGLGLKRGKPPLDLIGHWLVDAIRDRCRELGYSMRQLDEMANTGSYFVERQWVKKSGHRWLPMIKAAKMLGGELRVEWPD